MAERFMRPVPGNLDTVFALLLRSDTAEYGEPDSELSDLQHEWARMDLAQDAWIVKDEDESVVGYAALVPSRGERRVDVFIDPESADPALMGRLLDRCEDRARQIAGSRGLKTHTFLAHVNQRDRSIFTDAGFAYEKSYYQLHVDLHKDLNEPSWPEGIRVRNAVAGKDDQAIYQVVHAAFELSEDEALTFEQWKEHTIRPEVYDPDLWFLAIAGDEIVGTCLGVKYETEGWIRQFGVIPAWRGMGIATAMLKHAFLVFRDRGYDRVGLGMEAENESALRLYERLGMKVLRQYDEYRKVYTPTEAMNT